MLFNPCRATDLQFYGIIGKCSLRHYGHMVSNPLDEVVHHILVFNPFDFNILEQENNRKSPWL